MSNVVKFPAPPIRPNLTVCRHAIALCEHDPAMLLFVAHCGTGLVYDREAAKGGDPEQALVDRLAIAFFALAELLGVPDVAEALL
jgi:hypothetical protein